MWPFSCRTLSPGGNFPKPYGAVTVHTLDRKGGLGWSIPGCQDFPIGRKSEGFSRSADGHTYPLSSKLTDLPAGLHIPEGKLCVF